MSNILKCIFPCCFNKTDYYDEETSDIKNLNKIEFKKKTKNKKDFYYESNIIKKLELNDNYYARVIDIYDADTITVILFFRKNPYIIKIRLFGIDTPEMRPNTGNNELNLKEKALAIISKIFLKNLLEKNKNIIYIKTKGSEKYGRTLATLYIKKNDSISINQRLVNMNYADSYFGQKKEKNFQLNYFNLEDSNEIIDRYNQRKNTYNDFKKFFN